MDTNSTQTVKDAKKKKQKTPWGLFVIIGIFITMLLFFPFQFVKYSDGAFRVITPICSFVCGPERQVIYQNDEYTLTGAKVKVYFIPNNFKPYEELIALESEN